jgi:hypothetical protein
MASIREIRGENFVPWLFTLGSAVKIRVTRAICGSKLQTENLVPKITP